MIGLHLQLLSGHVTLPSRVVVEWPSGLDRRLDQEWREIHGYKVSCLRVDTEAFINTLMGNHFVLETLTAGSVYDPSNILQDMQRIMAQECSPDALVKHLAGYARSSFFHKVIKECAQWDVPRNWAKVMAIGFRRSLAALHLERTGELSLSLNYLTQRLAADLKEEEIDTVNEVYGITFSEKGVSDLENRWQEKREPTLRYMKETTEDALATCLRVKSLLADRSGSTQLLPPTASQRLKNLL